MSLLSVNIDIGFTKSSNDESVSITWPHPKSDRMKGEGAARDHDNGQESGMRNCTIQIMTGSRSWLISS
jgi:hypothetical protein